MILFNYAKVNNIFLYIPVFNQFFFGVEVYQEKNKFGLKENDKIILDAKYKNLFVWAIILLLH